MIVASNIKKSFHSNEIIKDVSFHVNQGEIFGLLGASGSGKTTLVKMMMGLEKMTSGSFIIQNTAVPALSLLKRTGYMAQANALYEELTAKENLLFFASLYGLNANKRKERMNEVIEIVNLQEHLNKPIHQYSGGMKRRLSLAIALVHEPDLLILDEPTVGLDPVLRKSIWEQFEQLTSQGKTIFVTTHVMDEAERCDRIALLSDGQFIGIDQPDKLKETFQTQTIEDIFLLQEAKK